LRLIPRWRSSVHRIIVNDRLLKTRHVGLHSCRRKLRYIFNHLTQCTSKATQLAEITQNNGHYAVQSHSRSPILVQSKAHIYDFLLVINTNLPPILHRFRDIAFDRSTINRYIWLPLMRLTPPTEGFSYDDLRKIFKGRQWMAKVPKGVKHCRKFQPAE